MKSEVGGFEIGHQILQLEWHGARGCLNCFVKLIFE